MKLRNKKTDEIVELSIYGIEVHVRKEEQPFYHSLAELNADWEDVEPLIKDEKVRKAVRAWADANLILGNEKVEVSTPTVDCTILTLTYGMTSIDIMINEEITLKNHGRYTIDELCGEEEE